jgi:hypothetical protein
MTDTAKSLVPFGIYMLVVGLVLMIIPNSVITLIGFTEVDDVWVRVFGWMLLSGGFLYVQVGRSGSPEFAHGTVQVRLPVVVVHLVLVLLDLAPPILIAFGAVDLVGAIWTRLALRSDNA